MRRLGRNLRQRQRSGTKTLVQQAAAALRKLGDGITAWIPGVGLVNGLQAGNWLDTAGTIAATVDNPMGLAVDAANGQLGSEIITNGDFSSGTTAGWAGVTLSVEDEKMKVLGGNARQSFPTVVGMSYLLTVDFTYFNPGGIYLGTTSSGSQIYSMPAINTSRPIRIVFVATTETTHITLWAWNGASTYCFYDKVSIKEVKGIHSTQPTTANKPTLRKGAVNQILWSEDFSNAAWTKANITVTPNSISAPNGTLSVDKIEATATAATLLWQAVANIGSSAGNSGKLTVKQGNSATSFNYFALYNVTTAAVLVAGTLNYSTGEFTYSTGSAGVVVVDKGDGFWELNMTATSGISDGNSVRLYIGQGGSSVAAGTYFYAWGAMLNVGPLADYAPTTSAPASNQVGPYWWGFDSTDLLTATFPAGYEAATIINTAETGQVTYTNQNIVGTYDIRGAVIGSELVTNGQFDSNITGWDSHPSFLYDTFEWSAGRLHVITDGSSRCIGGMSSASAFAVILGKAYKIEFTVQVISGQSGACRLNTNYHSSPVDGGTPLLGVSGVGTYTVSKIIFPTASVSAHITFDNALASAGEFFIDNVSIKEATLKEYGHFIFRTAPSASDLAVMQRYANRLAGLS